MPGKMARSAPDHRSGCPMRWWPSIPRVWLAGRPDKREYSRLFGSHLGNPSLEGTVVHPRAPPRSRRHAHLLLEGAVERSLRFISHLGRCLSDADAVP